MNQQEEADWKSIQRLALDYDVNKTYEENLEINPDVVYAWEMVAERRLKEKLEMMKSIYASIGIHM